MARTKVTPEQMEELKQHILNGNSVRKLMQMGYSDSLVHQVYMTTLRHKDNQQDK